MKKIIYVAFLAVGMTGCSVESLDSTDNLLTADAKFKIQEAQDPMGFYAGRNLKGTLAVWNDCDNLYVEILPSGDSPEDAELGLFSTLPTLNNGGNLVNNLEFDLTDATDLKWTISLSTLDTDAELLVFAKAWGDWAGTLVHGKQEYSTYEFDLEGCDCEESFTYEANNDGSYTFTYIPEEDMEGAEVVFTLAQSETDTGLEGWEDKGATKQTTMDFMACKVYEWTVTLTPDCNGNSKTSNIWTDFKVNDLSKKGSLENITASCE